MDATHETDANLLTLQFFSQNSDASNLC